MSNILKIKCPDCGNIFDAGSAFNDHVEKEEELPSKPCNTILADRHRVSICGWPIRGARDENDPRVKNIKSLFCLMKFIPS